MKKALTLILAAAMVLALAACGASPEVKAVQDQITALGEVTADSAEAVTAAAEAYKALPEEEQAKVKNAADLTAAQETLAIELIEAIGFVTADSTEAVTAAEAAYEALPEESRANVVNYEVLTDARETLDKALVEKELREALAGEWIILGNEYGSNCFGNSSPMLTIEENSYIEVLEGDPAGKCRITTGMAADVDRTGEYPILTVSLNGDDPTENSVMLMRKEDLAAWTEKELTAVAITADNLAEYIGEQTYLTDYLDEWGADTEMDVCYFPSTAYDKGLVYVGCSADFDLRVMDEWGNDIRQNVEGISPYMPELVPAYDGHLEAVDVVDGRGTLYYLPAEKVADVSYEDVKNEGSNLVDVRRIVTTTDGYKFVDTCNYFGSNNRSYYSYLADAGIVF